MAVPSGTISKRLLPPHAYKGMGLPHCSAVTRGEWPWAYFTLLYFTFFILLNCPSDLKLTLKAQGAAHDQTPY